VSTVRKEKLASILYAISDLEEFSSEGAQLRCQDSKPGYVTRVLNQLARDGLLNQVEVDNKKRYRWARDAKVAAENWIDRQVFGEQVKQSPEQDRPREQLLRDGASCRNRRRVCRPGRSNDRK
jgi:DNA repair protein RadC